MSLKLLAVGDMHLGRVPSRLPAGLDAGRLGPHVAWELTVDAAIRDSVHAVVLAGDVVEKENDFFEGYRYLQGGVKRLAQAGIAVLGVVGNHDASILPRLAKEIEHFDLLGENASWEKREITGGGELLTLWGWSMPAGTFTSSPLAGVKLERGPGLNLGVMHCDLDQSGSRYAPLSRRELESTDLDGWLLGHIHRPDPLAVPRPVGYLGSIMGFDPGEPGLHGPWLVTAEGGRLTAIQQWGLAPVRWERLDVDLSGLTCAEEGKSRLLAAVREMDRSFSGNRWVPDVVGLRVFFTGATRYGSAVERLFSGAAEPFGYSGREGTEFFLEGVRVLTRPETDLVKLAERSDPPGLLARRLLVLGRPEGDPERKSLIDAGRERMESRSMETRWQKLEPQSPSDEDVVGMLRRAGSRLLEELLSQQEIGS